jgi:glutamate synthase (NADPH/NADH) small chain
MVHQEEWEMHYCNQQITFLNSQVAYALHLQKSCVLGIIKEPVAIENIEKKYYRKRFC